MATISVIVPVYKVEPYLRRCVDSILAQTYTDFELILVDDGSPDNCGKICDEYAAKDNRIKVIHQANGGLSAARNAGIDWAFTNSNAQYITFVDSDDWVSPDYLAELFYGISLSSDASCTGYSTVDEYGHRNVRYPDRGWELLSPEEYWLQYDLLTVTSCGKLFSRELFRNVRFPTGKLHEDVFTTHQLLFPCKQIAFRQTPTYNYFGRTGSITKSMWSPSRLDALAAYRAQCDYFQGKFPRAYQHAHAALLAMIVDEAEHIRQYLPNDASMYQKMLTDAEQGEKLPFWPYRRFFRSSKKSLFWLRWTFAMMGDAIIHRRKSWICVEAFPIARQIIQASL